MMTPTTLRLPAALSAGLVMLACGTHIGLAAGPTSDLLALPTRTSPDGEPLIGRWDAPLTRELVVGMKSLIGPSQDAPTFVPAGTAPEADSHSQAVYLPDGSGVVVANRVSKNLTIFNPNTRALIKAIPLSGSPSGVAITPDGTKAVTANLFEGTASIVDLTTGVELLTLPAGPSPSTVSISPSGGRAIVHSGGVIGVGGPGTLTVINLATSTVERTIDTQIPVAAFGINFEAQGWYFKADGPAIAGESRAIFPNFYDDQVDVINLDTGAVTTLNVGDGPRGVAIYANGTRAAVTLTGSTQSVAIIDIPSATVLSTLPVGAALDGPICVSGDGTKAVVAILNACRVLNLQTGAVSGNLATASVNELKTTADGTHALCVGFNGSLISFASQTIVKTLNQFVSASVGAVSPVGQQAAMFSDTFGEDMVIVSTNPSTGTLLSAGPTGPAPEADKCRQVAVTPDGSKAVVVNHFSQSVTVVSNSGAILATLPMGRRGGAVAITPDGTKAVVAARDGTSTTVINLSTLTATDVPTANRGDQIRISPDSQWAYLAHVSPDVVSRINLSTLTSGGTLPAGNMGGYFQHYNSFSGLALSPDGTRLFTCNSFDNTLTVVNTASWIVSQTLPLGAGATFPIRAVYKPDGTRAYVSNRDSASVSTINTSGGAYSVIGTIAVGAGPTELAITPDGSRLFVIITGATPNRIDAINTATNTVIGSILFAGTQTIDSMAIGAGGAELAIARSGGSYSIGAGALAIEQSGSIVRVDTGTLATIEETETGRLNSSLAWGGPTIATANLMSEGLSLLSLAQPCFADCDGDGSLTIDDFICFQTLFALADPAADCDGDTSLTIDDFICFQTFFAIGC